MFFARGGGGRELATTLGERLPSYPIKGYSVTLAMRPDGQIVSGRLPTVERAAALSLQATAKARSLASFFREEDNLTL